MAFKPDSGRTESRMGKSTGPKHGAGGRELLFGLITQGP